MRYYWLFLIILIACGKPPVEEDSLQVKEIQAAASEDYFKSTQTIQINVYYEEDAKPFTGQSLGGLKYWNILESNLRTIFQYRSSPPNLVIPKELDEMNSLAKQDKKTWSANDVLKLHDQTQVPSIQKGESHFYIYFLEGNAEDGESIIGFSINGTPIIAIFKDVIRNSGGSVVQKYVEQSTIVHEMGHALGLVNNGVPLASDHQDQEHGHHTKNEDCIMYWLNEGQSDLAQFVGKYISSGSTIMWGQEVLADVEKISQ